MNVTAVHNSTLTPALSLGARGGASFAGLLDDAKREQARQDPFRGDLFHGGQGEEVFGAQLDEQLADRMSKSMKLPLTDAVYRQFTPGMSAGAAKGAVHG